MQDKTTVGFTDHLFEGRNVRSSIDSNGKPVVIANDLCDALGVEWRHVRDRIPEWGKGGPVRAATLGGAQTLATLTREGAFWVTLRSDKPGAEPFQKWVCCELLPAIFDQGFYALAGKAALDQIQKLELRLRAAKLRAEADALEGQARGFTARVAVIPEGYAQVGDFLRQHDLVADRAVAAKMAQRLSGGRHLCYRPHPRKGPRKLWPISALEEAARAAGLLPALEGEKGGA